ncbi:hypothetical protein HGB13_04050 [bacterium]|nr:hypothetical protein [bacterium]
MTSNKKIVERIMQLLEVKGWSHEQFGAAIGKSNVGKYLLSEASKDKRDPLNLLPNLANIGVSTDWILTGKGKMFLNDIRYQDESGIMDNEALRMQAKAIQYMFDRGLIKIDRGEKDAGSASGQVKEGHQELAITIPVFAHAIAAGKPVTCSGTIEEYITISANRVKHPKDTYAVKAFGDSMKDAGILEGDLLIVDRAIEPLNNHIVIASINDEQTVKRLRLKKGAVSLVPENTSYKPIEITGEMDFRTLGVVIYVIRKTT